MFEKVTATMIESLIVSCSSSISVLANSLRCLQTSKFSGHQQTAFMSVKLKSFRRSNVIYVYMYVPSYNCHLNIFPLKQKSIV